MSFIENITNTDADAVAFSEFFNEDAQFTVSRRVASNIYTLDHYLQYLDAIKLIYTQDSGSVTVAGVSRPTIGQLEINVNQSIADGEAAIADAIDGVTAQVENAIEGVAIDANLVTDALTTIVPMTAETTPNVRTQLKKNRESVSIMDFFTDSELAAFEADKTTFDAYRPIQEFFDYIVNNDVGVAHATIDAYIGQGLYFGKAGGGCATRVVIGALRLTALAPIDTMLYRELGIQFQWRGSLRLYGHSSGGTLYSWPNRTCRIAVDTHPTSNNARQIWGEIYAFGFQLSGLNIRGANTASHYEYARANACGVGHYPTVGYRLTSTFNNRTDTGSSSSGSQKSTVAVAYLPPENCIGALNSYVVINNEPYIITDIDYTTKAVSVFPWIDLTINTGTLSYVFGGGVTITGKDSSSLSFGTIEGTNNGINLHDSALYGAKVGVLMSQACGFGMNIGASKGDANLGGVVESYYAEGNHLDFVATTTAISNRKIINTHTVQIDKCYAFSARSSSTNTLIGQTLDNIRISAAGTEYRGIKAPRNQANSPELNFLDPLKMLNIYSATNQTVRLPDISKHKNPQTGADSQNVKVIGGNKYNAPTSVTFNLYSTTGLPNTSTLNGGAADVVFTNFAEPPVFTVYAEIGANNYKVFLNTRVAINPTVTLNSLASGGYADYPLVFDGVRTSDILAVKTNKDLLGTTLTATVSSAGNVVLRHANYTGTTVNLGSTSVDIKSL